jgi:toxin secretion/phage lysis holin
VVVDYITGLMRAITEKSLSSRIGAKGIVKKVLIFLLVGIANLADVYLLTGGEALRTAVIFFYIANEGISLLENATAIGLPVPEKLKDVLAQLHGKDESK